MTSRDVIFGLGRVLRALPLRAASIHACVSDSRVKAAATIAALLIGSNNTVLFPVSPMGDVDIARHSEFLQQRRNQESMAVATSLFQIEYAAIDGGNGFLDEMLPRRTINERDMVSDQSESESGAFAMGIPRAPQDTSPSLSVLSMGIPSAPQDSSPAFSVDVPPAPSDTSPVIVPGAFDILLGRGKSFQNHKGNLRYRQIIESFREQYESMGAKREKTKLIKDV
ncbi:MAG: hypothetical protein SGARI_005740, partial [Bacillariaceae sp.]